eukprot:scaffold12445_cov115-Cylindrotheca_fusiformis.AAC.2
MVAVRLKVAATAMDWRLEESYLGTKEKGDVRFPKNKSVPLVGCAGMARTVGVAPNPAGIIFRKCNISCGKEKQPLSVQKMLYEQSC